MTQQTRDIPWCWFNVVLSSAILAHHWTNFWVNVCWGWVNTHKLTSFSTPLINIHDLSVSISHKAQRDHYVCRKDNRDQNLKIPKKKMWNHVKKLYKAPGLLYMLHESKGRGRFINEICVSTGFMNGVTSLFVPNISSDHDNNVGGPMAPPTKIEASHPATNG